MKNENWTENGYSEHGKLVMWQSAHDGFLCMFVKIEGMETIEAIGVGAWINTVETDEPFITNEILEYTGITHDREHRYIPRMALFMYPIQYRPECEEWLELYYRLTNGLVEIDLYE